MDIAAADWLSYKRRHQNVRVKYGPASDYHCVDCDGYAKDWAHIHNTDPDIVDNYEPMCRSCHKKYDYNSPWGEDVKKRISNSKLGKSHPRISRKCEPNCNCMKHTPKPVVDRWWSSGRKCLPDCTCGRHRGSKR